MIGAQWKTINCISWGSPVRFLAGTFGIFSISANTFTFHSYHFFPFPFLFPFYLLLKIMKNKRRETISGFSETSSRSPPSSNPFTFSLISDWTMALIFCTYSQTCPIDQLAILTPENYGHANSVPSNVYSAYLKTWPVPPEKCESRMLEVGPKPQSDLSKVTWRVK